MFDSVERLDDASGVRSWRCRIAAMLVLASCTQPPAFAWAAGGQKFRADEWITECDSGPSAGAPDCSIPIRAVLRVDKNPPIECRQPRYCVFPSTQALAVLRQLKVGSLILIDVFTEKGAFNFSLTPKGYQAGMAQIRAWGYRTE